MRTIGIKRFYVWRGADGGKIDTVDGVAGFFEERGGGLE